MSVTYDAGIATSYAAAVAGGYTGTKEQYYAEQAQFAINAQRVAQDRTAVEQAVSGFTSTTVPGAIQSVTSEGNTQVRRVKEAGDEYLEDIDSRIDDAVADLKEDLEANYAKIDGTYPDMTVGTAQQLDTDQYTEDSEPYHFRRSGGGSVRVGEREIDKIVGGTVAWNQLVNVTPGSGTSSGISYEKTANGKVAFNGTATNIINVNIGQSISVIGGHVYLPLVGNLVSRSTGDLLMVNAWTSTFQYGKISKCTASTTGVVSVRFDSGITLSGDYYIKLIDLTAAFGTTIADYIYSLETSTAGAGVAWVRKYIDIDTYHPYDAGTLKSVEGLISHDMMGFNQFDKSTAVENSRFNRSGVASVSGTSRSDYIPCASNTDYYFKNIHGYVAMASVYWFDENKSFVSYSSIPGDSPASGVITSPANAKYVGINYPTEQLDNVCINLSDPAKNGTYEPYEKHSYPLDSTLTLRGVPKLVDGKLQYDGDTYAADGTVTRRYGVVDLGTLNWNTATATSRAFATVPNMKIPSSTSRLANVIVENNYVQKSANTSLSEVGQFAVLDQNQNIVFYYDGTNPSGYMVYELATPTTEEADPFTNPQWVDGSGTEQYVSTSLVPIGHYTQYPEDLKAKIEGLPWNFASLIAPTEASYKATQAYSTGALFIVNNTLYKATTTIANGGTITPGTNCAATTLAAVIAAL